MNEKEKKEFDKAMSLVNKSGYLVIKRPSLAANPYIGELSELLENAGYRLDEAKIERGESCKATGRILLALFPLEVLKEKEREGKC